MSSKDQWSTWMKLAQQGDKQAYGQLLTEIEVEIRTFLTFRLGPFVSRDDAVQECLMAVHKARHTYDSTRPFRPWLLAVTRFKAIDLLRKQKKLWDREVFDENILATKPSTHSYKEVEEGIEIEQSLTKALEAIPEQLREAVILTKLNGHSTKVAAEKIGISEVALRSRISRGYKILRKLLERETANG